MEIICRICKAPKDENDFWKQPKNKSGRESACKGCRSTRSYERRRERRVENGLPTKLPTLEGRRLAEDGKKYCPTCKQIKDIKEDFSTTKSGIASHCKECNAKWNEAYRQTPKGKRKKREDYKRNKEKLINQKLKRKFGMTFAEYKVRLDEQGNRCIICGRTPEENGKMLAVDHNHKTGKNRALLCSSCNICIGFIEKNALDTKKISEYLLKHNI